MDEISENDVIFSERRDVRYAYMHKKNKDKFGLLEAVDYRDARQWLGSMFCIAKTKLSYNEEKKQMFDRDYRLTLVDRAFREKSERTTRGGGLS